LIQGAAGIVMSAQ